MEIPILGTHKKPPFVKCMVLCCTTMLLYMAGSTSYDPLFSQFVRQRVREEYFNTTTVNTTGNDDFCTRNSSSESVVMDTEIEKKSSELILNFKIPGKVAAVLSNLILGSYSDFLGRRFLFWVPCLGAALNGIVLVVVVGLHLPIHYMYIGTTLDGLSGSYAGFLMAVFAYTADVTPGGKSRTLMIATMEGVISVSGSLGQLAVGYIIQHVNFLYASLVVTALFCMAFVVVLALLPESMLYHVNKEWNLLPHFKRIVGFFVTCGSRKQRGIFILSMLIVSFTVLVLQTRSSLETLYQLGLPFCWSPMQIAYYGALTLSSSTVISVIFLMVFQSCFRDMTIALFGLGFGIASLVLEGLAVNDWMLYLVPVLGVITSNAVPVARATMSKMMSPLDQGALFASIATVESVCAAMSTTVFNSVYQVTLVVFRGAVFMLMAGCWAITTVLIIVLLYITRDGEITYETSLEINRAERKPSITAS